MEMQQRFQENRRRGWTGPGWTVRADGSTVHVVCSGRPQTFSASDSGAVEVRRSLLGLGPAYIANRHSSYRERLRGLSRRESRAMRHRLAALELFAVLEWGDRLDELIERGLDEQRWISRERRDEITQDKPVVDISRSNRRMFPDESERAAGLLKLDVDGCVAETNQEIVTLELESQRSFLETIEKQPLTDEQARAVLEYDNRVQVVAAAGSGKTSIMVARAAYAIHKGITTPDRVLLLAFNKAAAVELEERVEERFSAAGIPSEGIRASTFHALGLRAIAGATGAKPRVAPWVADSGSDTQKVAEIVDLLRDESTEYRYKWDLFRLIFARAPTRGPRDATPDGYENSSTGYRTLDGHLVKSAGERMISDWLFINGLEYEYEAAYRHPTATTEYGQYHPDFYYPALDTWHEHWALDANGEPPEEFTGYAEGMRWKRAVHRQNQTDLIETTWHEIVVDVSFDRLASELVARGAELDWDPTRIDDSAKVMKDGDLERLIRTFMTHVKSNSLTREDLEERLRGHHDHLAGRRTELFLEIFWPVYDAWNEALADKNYVDFEDMLVQAADHLEQGNIDLGYDLVLADEFQDASRARTRMTQGLVSRPHRHLLAVGDDWQSINRFAGADIAAMTEFGPIFGDSSRLGLTRTFRFPQKLADVSSKFVMENPRQIRKEVRSSVDGGQSLAEVIEVVYEEPGPDVVAKALKKLGERDTAERSVFVLGRYRFDEELVPFACPPNLKVKFSTVHGSKGLEADYIVLPNMGVGTYGFPSGVEDDPVLDLAMTDSDPFAHAEERRLFYVALTRARRGVVIITRLTSPSPFVVELAREWPELRASSMVICAICEEGSMVLRVSKAGNQFYGCSRFPACTATSPTPTGTPKVTATTNQDKSAIRCVCGGRMVRRDGRYGPFLGCTEYTTSKNCKRTISIPI